MSTLQEEIDALQSEQAIEAAQFLCESLVVTNTDATAARAALGSIVEAPFEHLAAVEELARLVLRAAAEMPDYVPMVHNAIAGVGRKQVVLGGTEIVALSVVGLLALNLIVTKGKTEERREEIVETDAKTGKAVMRIKTNVKFGLGSSLAGVLTTFFGK